MGTPDTIGPYRVIRPIAAGGTAEVYEVHHPISAELLALKLLVVREPPALAREATVRFNREYEAMSRLNHPSIVRAYHYGLHDGQPWLTMELLRGLPAQAAVKRAGRPGSEQRTMEVLRIGYFVAQALRCVHERKLVHRDLKSANVLVLPDERVKLLDFGAVSQMESGPERLTAHGEFIGTFAYASPEQIASRPVDGRSDLYSLGVLLYRLATGRRPFESDDEGELTRMHLSQMPADPRSLAPDLPRPLSEIILSLLAKRPADRPQSAEILAKRLEEIHERPFSSGGRLALNERGSAQRDLSMRAVLASLDTPGASLITVDGDEGSDRMRFIDAIHEIAVSRGFSSHVVPPGRGPSVQRILEAFGAISVRCGSPEASAALAEIAQGLSPSGLAEPARRSAARAAAVQLVRLAAAKSKVALLVQEIHRADPPTIELLTTLRRSFPGGSVPFKLVVGGYSPPLAQGTELAHRLGDGLRVTLAPMTIPELSVSVGNLIGRRPPPAAVARHLHAICGGLPLYTEEAVADLVDLGGVEVDGEKIVWTDRSLSLSPPERPLAAARRCFEALPFHARQILEALQIASDAADGELLAKMLGWSLSELQILLDLLIANGTLQTQDGQRYEWRIPLLAEVVSSSLRPCRRIVLSRALIAQDLPPSPATARAFASLGRTSDAIRTALAAGRKMIERSELRSLMSLLSEIVPPHLFDPERSKPTPAERAQSASLERSAELAEALLLYAHCATRVSPNDPTSGRAIGRAKSITETRGDRVAIARALLEGAHHFAALSHYANYRKELRRAYDAQSGQQPTVALQIATELSWSYRLSGDLPKSELWQKTGASLRAASRDDALAVALFDIESSSATLASGRLFEAEQTLSIVLQRLEAAPERSAFWLALARWANTLRHQGRFSEALARLAEQTYAARQCEDPVPLIELLLATAAIELELSRLGRAQECCDELTAITPKGGYLNLRLEIGLLKGRLSLASGEPRLAAYHLQEILKTAHAADLLVIAELARVLHAEALACMGDREGSQRSAKAALLGLMGSGDLFAMAEGCRSAARLNAAARDPNEIFRPVQRLLDEQPTPLLRIEHQLALSVWHRARGERELFIRALDEVRSALNKMIARLDDMDRAAMRVHPWSASLRGEQQ